MDPNLVCTEQIARAVVLTGEGLSPTLLDTVKGDTHVELPHLYLLRVQDVEGGAVAAAEEIEVPPDALTWQSQQQLTPTLDPALGLEPGLYDLRVKNGSGRETSFPSAVTVVPPPTVESMLPSPTCVAQGDREYTVSGTGFMVIGGSYPDVLFDGGAVLLTAHGADGCAAVPGQPDTVQRCTSLALTIPEDGLEPGLHAVTVRNPAATDCSSVEDVKLLVVPPPQLTDIEPDLLCVEQEDQPVVLTGVGFLSVDGVLPTVAIGAVVLNAEALEDCTALEGAPVPVQSCSTLRLVVPMGAVDTGSFEVTVTNPPHADCVSEETVTMLFVPPPTVGAVDPDILCLEEDGQTITVTGTGFLDVDGVLPTVSVGTVAVAATSVEGCEDLAGSKRAVRSCTQLVAELPQGALPNGTYAVVVTNPIPADCSSVEEVTLVVTPPPTVDAVAPMVFCDDESDTEITVTGAGFLTVDGVEPVVVIGDATYPSTGVDGCVAIDGTTRAASACASLTATVPAGALAEGWHDVTVTNPLPAACSGTVTNGLYALSAPVITTVGPLVDCDQNPTGLRLQGSGFVGAGDADPAVTVEGAAATVTAMSGCTPIEGTTVEVCTQVEVAIPAGTVGLGTYGVVLANPGDHACGTETTGFIGVPPTVSAVAPMQICVSGFTITVTGDGFVDGAVVLLNTTALPTTFVDAQTLSAVVGDTFEPGLYDVTVRNPDGCTGTLPAGFDIEPLPILFFVDPPVAYNQINLQVTIYATGILGTVTDVDIYPAGQPEQAQPLDFVWDPARPNRIQAVVPAGLDPGAYGLSVLDDVGCFAELAGALTIVGETTVAIDRVELPFGWTDGSTGVNVYSPDPAPAGMANFAPTPRFYLNPVDAGPETVATELKFTSFVSAFRVSATIREGLPVGTYDLVAVNPDGGVGYLAAAFEVTALPPPVVTDLAPASVVNQGVQTVTVFGADFDGAAVDVTCRQPDGSFVDLAATVAGSDATTIDVSMDFGVTPAAAGSACVFRVTNADGTWYDFSAMGITNPSLNLESFDATTDLNVARRAVCAAAGAAAPGARYVYAIGGDDGTGQDTLATTRFDTVEFAAIDPYGDLAEWSIQPYRLPVPLSFHSCAQLGRFIYVVGGSDGASAVNTVYRAQILDPEDAPEILDVVMDVLPDEAPLLPAGLYSYRISALMAEGDLENPGGETLAGDALLMQTPALEDRLTITLTWEEVPGAVAYRVYRTPTPGLASGNEVLIEEVPAAQRTFTDDGSLTPGTDGPLPFGVTGQFAAQPSMGSHREGAGLALAAHPGDPATWFLYALGGRDEALAALDTVEWLTITIEADGGQTVSASWTQGTESIGTPRWQLKAFVGNHLMAPNTIPAGDVWIYAGGGIDGDLTPLFDDVVALKVAAGGALGEGAAEWWTVDNMPARAGYSGSLFNDQLFVFGGAQGGPDNGGASAEICANDAGACGGGAPGAPDLANWNNLGLAMTHQRYLSGDVVVSAFVFLVGGVEGTDPPWVPLAATEKTLW